MNKHFLTSILLGCGLLSGALPAGGQTIIPLPAEYSEAEGQFSFAQGTQLACEALPDSLKAEALRFAEVFEKSSGIGLVFTSSTQTGISCVRAGEGTCGPEGYRLSVAPEGITVEAETSAGFFYAFQSLKMLLPRNVMAEKADDAVTAYAAPACRIEDTPRFAYRGFMLDCSRHFFSVDEIKRILDVMAYYKMNRFHWHLTDDQGWRFEMPKYPRLQTVAATRQGSYNVDPVYGRYYVADEYGPFYYTQEQMKDIVAYAAERHIEVVPEIEMPGHLCAVVTAYPEFSCNPYGSHRVWNDGGISTDVLDISNPKAVQFCKDVLDELVKIFPYEYIHIGGDECPTSAWESSASCKALKDSLGYTNIRGLQSHFTHELAQYMANKENPAERRKLIAWNESVTAGGSDTQLLKDDNLTIMCWTGAENASNVAQNLGMQTILTPQPQWYINRKQSPRPNEVHNAGNGTDCTLDIVYNHKPSVRAKTIGVQGTFWCEHVSSDWGLEYQALPRLIAIAEVGWTQNELRDFDNFLGRLRTDTTLLNYGNYAWCDYLVKEVGEAEKVMPKENVYYQLNSRGNGDRTGRSVTLLSKDAPALASYKGSGAAIDKLWSDVTITDEADTLRKYQMWMFVPDPDGSGKYAMVCQACPEGSVSPTASAATTDGIWSYDRTARHYNFLLGEGSYYGQDGDSYYYSIRSDQYNGLYMNVALSGRQFRVNVYGDPADGNGGLFTFVTDEEESGEVVDAPTIAGGKTYRITVTGTPEWPGLSLSDNGKATLGYSTQPWCNDAWNVTATEGSNGVQTITLTNAATKRAVSSVTAPVQLGSQAANLTLTYSAATGGYTIGSGTSVFIPVGEGYAVNPGTFSTSTNALVPQGSDWTFTEVATATYTATDESGEPIGTFTQSVPLGEAYTPVPPVIDNYECLTDPASLEGSESVEGNLSYKVTYRRTAFSATLRSVDAAGNLIDQTAEAVPAAEAAAYSWTAPEFDYYSYSSASATPSFALDRDSVVTLTYTTAAVPSFSERLDEVTSLEDGKYYLIYNNDPRTDNRNGFLSINPLTGQITAAYVVSGSPLHVWKAERNGTGFKLRASDGRYIPQLPRGGATYVSDQADVFTFTYDGTDWAIRSSNGCYFDGNGGGGFTGWDAGEPVSYKIYTFRTEPYFSLTYICQLENGTAVGRGTYTFFVPAGDTYTLECPVAAPSDYPKVTCSEKTASGVMTGNLTVTYTFSDDTDGISGVEAGTAAESAAWYDLGGRRINGQPAAKGVYIHGGKKVYVE